MMDPKKLVKVLNQQEDMLKFDTFTNKEAFELGTRMAQKVYDAGQSLAIGIFNVAGMAVYQHVTPGATVNNTLWMRRKFNTVMNRERSSLWFTVTSEMRGKDLAAHVLDTNDYALVGGGFPIRLKTGELVAVAVVSAFPHYEDHQFIVDALAEYLGIDDVPSVLEFYK
ncbi:MAG: heme-binding protein [Lachnospiraceae bacterium]|jgi:uncharacterized protein (UPF0303 family)|nr:heme-binding protein [Lachnospiraceae bacterium]